MELLRLCRHLATTSWTVQRRFPASTLKAIKNAIAASELQHAGQIRFAVEGALHGTALLAGNSPRARAIDVFSQLRVWDTEHNIGVLIYVLIADKAVEIVADRGVCKAIEGQQWPAICRDMEKAFKAGQYEAGVLQGIDAVTRSLAAHFPRGGTEHNELPNQPVVL